MMGLLKKLLTLSLALSATRAAATVITLPSRAVMEGIPASQGTILIDTTSRRVDIDTNSYNGHVSSVSVFTSSNVVLSDNSGQGDKVVLYSTGSMTALTIVGSGAGITSLTATNISGTIPSSNLSGVYSNVTGLGSQAQALNLNTHLINGVVDPASAQDAATKNYVDSNVLNLDYKTPVRLGTTAALPANVYANGSSGVGATITGSGLGLLTIDSATPLVGDRVMVNNETLASHNGLYLVTTNAGGAFFVLTRTTDFNTAVEMTTGTLVSVTSGTVNANGGVDPSTWLMTTAVNIVGTDPVGFIETSGLGEVVAGTGITITGSTISTSGQTVVCGAGLALTGASYSKGVASGGTCTATGVGDVVQAGINTFSSSNTFVAGSTIAVVAATSVAGTTTTIGNFVRASGLWSVASSSNPVTSQSSWTFTGFSQYGSSTIFHCVVIECIAGSASDLQVQINSDGASNYVSANTAGANVGGGSTACALTQAASARSVSLGNCGMAQFFITNGQGLLAANQTYLTGTFMNYGDSGGTSMDNEPVSCRYSGIKPFNTITFLTGSGGGTWFFNSKCTVMGN